MAKGRTTAGKNFYHTQLGTEAKGVFTVELVSENFKIERVTYRGEFLSDGNLFEASVLGQ